MNMNEYIAKLFAEITQFVDDRMAKEREQYEQTIESLRIELIEIKNLSEANTKNAETMISQLGAEHMDIEEAVSELTGRDELVLTEFVRCLQDEFNG